MASLPIGDVRNGRTLVWIFMCDFTPLSRKSFFTPLLLHPTANHPEDAEIAMVKMRSRRPMEVRSIGIYSLSAWTN